ncbi:MAG: hypothetical protein IPK50_01470 [Fibrobacterota bacterium]|nr:MAG: hypothetical protein IPK50_01470 [Fibrobacterota bacterium]
MHCSRIALLLAATLAVGLSSCTSESSPTAPAKSPAPASTNPRVDAALVGSWFTTSISENQTFEFSADSSLRVVSEEFDSGKIYRIVALGSWASASGKLTVRLKSATRSIDGGAASAFKNFEPLLEGNYIQKGDSLVVTDDSSRVAYRKGTAPALVKPTLKAQVVGSWKALDVPYESTIQILAGGTYSQITMSPLGVGSNKWSKVEGTWTIAGTTLVLNQVKMSDSSNGATWNVVSDFFPLADEWPLTFPAWDRMSFQADQDAFEYERL